MAFAKLFSLVLVAAINVQEICGGGKMMDPINRSSAWRKDFPVKSNCEDSKLSCGGFAVQNGKNDGMCGECGDDYSLPRPRPNENGGIYGTGVIVEKYETGAVVNVTVNILNSRFPYFAYFEFSLCPLKSPKELETEECFNQYRLPLANGRSYRNEYTSINFIRGDETVVASVVLPKDLTCEHCVFRWQYETGMPWDECESRKGDLGCIFRGSFRNCADISISKAGSLARSVVPEVPAEAFEIREPLTRGLADSLDAKV